MQPKKLSNKEMISILGGAAPQGVQPNQPPPIPFRWPPLPPMLPPRAGMAPPGFILQPPFLGGANPGIVGGPPNANWIPVPIRPNLGPAPRNLNANGDQIP
jgi:hypothetical protein